MKFFIREEKGASFLSFLTFIIAVAALVLSIIAYNRSGGTVANLKSELRDFQFKVEDLKKDTARQLKEAKEETAKAIERFKKAVD